MRNPVGSLLEEAIKANLTESIPLYSLKAKTACRRNCVLSLQGQVEPDASFMKVALGSVTECVKMHACLIL